ncbi:MAG: hypothetical protein M2R45_03633 [Verrucomicrobia subdivision 3 bacterium]|nr:hypothetical protein [Limisphaerales bacterium]MCS1416871.1 hypothetical protein [Limisphaerales bacterium]
MLRLVTFEPQSTRAFVFGRQVGGGMLQFKDTYADGKLVDEEMGSH